MKTNPSKWASLPGNIDVLNVKHLFYSDNKWGIPLIEPTKKVPLWLAPYKHRLRSVYPVPLSDGAYHFFMPPQRFKCVWERPREGLRSISRLSTESSPATALSPAFPLDGTLPQQILATYKNRWIGAWWQAQGILVIPSVLWNGRRSYNFAFAGISQGGVVAVTNKNITEQPEGFRIMMELLNPIKVLCFGESHSASVPEIIDYPKKFHIELTRQEVLNESASIKLATNL